MRLLLLISSLLIFTFSYAQRVLVIEKIALGKRKQVIFYVKDHIKVKTKKGRYAGTIVAIGDSAFLLSSAGRYDTIEIKHVKKVIYQRSNRVTAAFSQAFVMAGVLVVGIDSFNSLINNEAQLVHRPVIIAGIWLVSAGLLVKLCERRSRKMGKKNSIHVINLSAY